MNILLLVAAGMAVAEDTSSTLKDCVRTGEAVSGRLGDRAGPEWTWGARPRNCKDLQFYGDCWSGLRYIYPYNDQPNLRVKVYCEQRIDGGGWTVIQRRTDKPIRNNDTTREDFHRKWLEYKLGFGKLEGEFWLGNDHIHTLTSGTLQELRIDMDDWSGHHRWAKYQYFYVGPESAKYRLHIGRYSGDAGDSMWYHNGVLFTTKDQDNSSVLRSDCGQYCKGGWWYVHCATANLNGYPHKGKFYQDYKEAGIKWHHWTHNSYSLKYTTMMLRPAF